MEKTKLLAYIIKLLGATFIAITLYTIINFFWLTPQELDLVFSIILIIILAKFSESIKIKFSKSKLSIVVGSIFIFMLIWIILAWTMIDWVDENSIFTLPVRLLIFNNNII